jgi:hypothetical protein
MRRIVSAATAILPTPPDFARHFLISLMDEHCRLQRLPGIFVRHLGSRQTPQLVLQQGHKLFRGLGVVGVKDAGDAGHDTILGITPGD